MDNQQQQRPSSELVNRFLSNECTVEEASWLVTYFQERPEELDEYLRVDWKSSRRARISSKDSALMLKNVMERLSIQQPSIPRSFHIKWMGAAAAVLLCAVLCWFFLSNKNSGNEIAVMQPVKHVQAWMWKYNTSDTLIQLTLPDGSTVSLWPGASLKFPESFAKGVRNVYLSGKGFFEVRKDSVHPFTVFSKVFSTTALGTSFSVEETDSSCEVRLHTGKVVIKRSDIIKGWKDVILVAGQSMVYTGDQNNVAIGNFKAPKKAGMEKVVRPAMKKNLSFINTPLSEVFTRLSDYYEVSIEFDTSGVKDKYFTGTILPKDKLHILLPVIAGMNGLEVASTAGSYRVQ